MLDWAGLAATTAGTALLYTLTGFGFAVLAAPLFLLLVDPQQAIQLTIIISTALSFVALPGLWRTVTPWLLLRLALGTLAGLPFGLIAFRYADPVLVRALVGATPRLCRASLAEAARPERTRWRLPHETRPQSRNRGGIGYRHCACRDGGTAGADLFAARWSAAAGRARDPALVLRLAYTVTLVSHAVTVGIPAQTWLSAGVLTPFAFLGGLAARLLGDRLGPDSFTILAILLLAAAGIYTLAAAVGLAPR